IIQHCTRHSESKIGFGDLILLPRYFFKQQMSTDPILNLKKSSELNYFNIDHIEQSKFLEIIYMNIFAFAK
uniref:hypothetical protein n=1 Tax=Acinetobacter sp. F16 TaxID=3462438 RepID=UPI004046C36A